MLIFYLSLSLGVSFFCSLFEAVILSITPAFVASVSDAKGRWARLIKRQKTLIDDSLAAILTLNTISHTIGAAGVGAEILKLYGNEYVAIGSAILTLLILFLSEIVPKTLGATYTRSLAPFTAYGIEVFIYITYPVVKICNLLSRALGAGAHLKRITREEVAYTAQIGHQEGSLSEDEATIISNLLRLRKVIVKDVMTPRTVVFSLGGSLTVSEVLQEHPSISYSRIPVYGDGIDNIIGVLFRYELLEEHAKGNGERRISELVKPLHPVSDLMNIARALDTFLKRKEHLFSVHDEHGGFEGVITLEDVIETILGVEITDEFDTVEDLRVLAKKQWEARKSHR